MLAELPVFKLHSSDFSFVALRPRQQSPQTTDRELFMPQCTSLSNKELHFRQQEEAVLQKLRTLGRVAPAL